jgi:hypothetical protein
MTMTKPVDEGVLTVNPKMGGESAACNGRNVVTRQDKEPRTRVASVTQAPRWLIMRPALRLRKYTSAARETTAGGRRRTQTRGRAGSSNVNGLVSSHEAEARRGMSNKMPGRGCLQAGICGEPETNRGTALGARAPCFRWLGTRLHLHG